MGRTQGKNTKAIAVELLTKLEAEPKRYEDFKVYYDHGDSTRSEVCAPTTYTGERYGRNATLSQVDIVVTKGRNVILGIEIEESTGNPKTVLGDVFGIALADKMRIQDNVYSVENITVIIAVTDDGEGSRSVKCERLERHLTKYVKENPSISLKKVRIIACPKNDLVRRIERLIRSEIGKHNS